MWMRARASYTESTACCAAVRPDASSFCARTHTTHWRSLARNARARFAGDVFVSIAELIMSHPEFQDVQGKVVRRTGMDPFRFSDRQYTLFLPTGACASPGTAASSQCTRCRPLRKWLTCYVCLLLAPPSDDALAAANKTLAGLSKEQLVQVLRYHMLPGTHPLPAGIKPGQLYKTELKGQHLKFEFEQVDVPSASKNGSSSKGLNIRIITDTFKGNASSAPRVDLANMFAQRVSDAEVLGVAAHCPVRLSPRTTADIILRQRPAQIVVHGIDKVLMPDLKKASAAPAPAAVPPKASTPRALLRALLQFRSSGTIRGVTVNGLSITNTQSAIRQAAEGRSTSADAAASGTFYARAATARCWNCESLAP